MYKYVQSVCGVPYSHVIRSILHIGTYSLIVHVSLLSEIRVVKCISLISALLVCV